MWFFLLALLTIVSLVTAGQHGLEGRAHKGIARRAPAPSNETDVLEKRGQFSGRWTFFDVGLGACGKYNQRNDYIVALNTAQYGYGSPGPQCFKMITMSYNGKTATAQIMDECPSCGYGDLDLSRGLFDHFASEDLGQITGSWSWGSGGGNSNPAPAPAPKPKPKTTTKKEEPAYTPPAPKPKTTYTPPEPTTTKERVQVKPSSSSASKVKPSSMSKSKASSTKSSSSSTSTSSSINYNTGSAAGLAIPKGSVAKNSTAAAGSLIALNNLFIQFGSLIVTGGAGQ